MDTRVEKSLPLKRCQQRMRSVGASFPRGALPALLLRPVWCRPGRPSVGHGRLECGGQRHGVRQGFASTERQSSSYVQQGEQFRPVARLGGGVFASGAYSLFAGIALQRGDVGEILGSS